MKKNYKVLLVEDVERYREMYLDCIRDMGDNVEIYTADSRLEALEKVSRHTFDLAYVDIMLIEDTHDSGGLDVIERLVDLGEGTQVIPLTATANIDVAISAYEAGIFTFIKKSQIRGCDDITRPGLEALKAGSIAEFGKYKTLQSYLAAPEQAGIWEDKMFRTLQVSYKVFNDALWAGLNGCFPLMKPVDGSSFHADADSKSIHASFWSKGRGVPLWISFANEKGSHLEPPEEYDPVALEAPSLKKGVSLKMWRLRGCKREMFQDRIV